uniref:Progestin and adipoQ receptor family member 4 n=1 Tax=Vombatus ursinus TaxID=29139 RepID=A0A4X2L4V1_VOMUR
MARKTGRRLLSWANSPCHLQFNPFVLTGYRPTSGTLGCVYSLFYLHNELGNIYIHALPMIHCTLACWPRLRLLALVAHAFLSTIAGWQALTARSTVARLRAFGWQATAHLLVFAVRGMGLGTGAPGSLPCYLRTEALALLGGLVNVARLPERWKPGAFDYWCNSHQIMHLLSVISILQLHAGVVLDLIWAAHHAYACPAD